MTAHVGAGNKVPEAALDEILRHVAQGKSVVVASQLVGYNDRTVYRAARNSVEFRLRLDAALNEGRARRQHRCGTYAAYRRGCRCAACRAANSTHTRSFRDRQRAYEAAS